MSSNSVATTSSGPKPPVVQPSASGHAIIVNPCQRLNPVLECIRNVSKEFGDIAPDFQVGRTTCVLFLSLKYHRLHPEYIHQRIQKLGHSYSLRILLLMCDISEHQDPIRELTKVCLINNLTIVVAWSADEAGQYLSTYKQFEHRPPDMIKERVDKDHASILRSALTTISKVNKTDVETLRTSFGSFADIAKVTSEQLQPLPGFGQVKVRRLQEAFNKPFRNNATSSLTSVSSSNQSTKSKGKQKESNNDQQNTLTWRSNAKGTQGESNVTSSVHQDTDRATSRHREPSPIWDIELDLDDIPPTAETGPPPDRSPSIRLSPTRSSPAPRYKKRPPSPVWDIELDLNTSDEDRDDGLASGGSKRRKVTELPIS